MNLVGGWSRMGAVQILFSDDTELVADLENKLQKLVVSFGRVYES